MVFTKYRVRPGQQLAHQGKVLLGGDVVELPQSLAHEVRHLVDPVGADGKIQPWPTDRDAALATDLAAARPHERISILRAYRASGAAQLADLDREIAAEETRLQAESAPAPTAAVRK